MEEISTDIATAFGASARGQKFSLYIPNQDQHGNPVDQARWVESALRLFSDLFGGATVFPDVRGAWLNQETRKLVIEEPQIIYSFVTAQMFEDGIARLRQFMLDMGRQTNQGQIGFEFDGTLFLLDI